MKQFFENANSELHFQFIFNGNEKSPMWVAFSIFYTFLFQSTFFINSFFLFSFFFLSFFFLSFFLFSLNRCQVSLSTCVGTCKALAITWISIQSRKKLVAIWTMQKSSSPSSSLFLSLNQPLFSFLSIFFLYIFFLNSQCYY